MPTGKDYLSSRADGEGETVSAIVVSQQQRRGAGKDRGGITEVGGGAAGRRRSGWACSWAESQHSGGIAQLGAGGSLRIEDQLAWWSRSGGRRNRRAAG